MYSKYHSHSVFCQKCCLWCTACCSLRHLLGRSWIKQSWGFSQTSGIWICCGDVTACRYSRLRAQHAPQTPAEDLWFFPIGNNYGPYCYICPYGGGQFYVNTSFHVSKAKPRTGLWSQQVCASFHKNMSKFSCMLCNLYLTSMTCAPEHLVFCSTNISFIFL